MREGELGVRKGEIGVGLEAGVEVADEVELVVFELEVESIVGPRLLADDGDDGAVVAPPPLVAGGVPPKPGLAWRAGGREGGAGEPLGTRDGPPGGVPPDNRRSRSASLATRSSMGTRAGRRARRTRSISRADRGCEERTTSSNARANPWWSRRRSSASP